ncbi:MAG: hypothetical protein INQ03_24110 [Candidatus Heimdallarchaeota archaeon]|nr:hypothetical protein [Candidatus Heimdallarchaeota archaeon]
MQLQLTEIIPQSILILNELYEIEVVSYQEKIMVEERMERDGEKYPELFVNNIDPAMEYVFSFLRLLCLDIIHMLKVYYSTKSRFNSQIPRESLYLSLKRIEYRSISYQKELLKCN